MGIILKGKDNWSLRPRQVDCVNKILAAKEAGQDKFLIAAVCRFGKTVTALGAADLLTTGDQVVVVVSTMNVKDEWKKGAERAGYSTDLFNTEINDIDFDTLTTAGRHLIYVSTQKLGNETASSEALIAWVNRHAGQHVVIYDECHLGSGTDRTNNFLGKMSIDFRIYLSGTPYRKHLKKMFNFDLDQENSFIYSITDEREDYKNGIITDDDYTPVQLQLYVMDYIEKNAEKVFGKSLDEKQAEVEQKQKEEQNKGKALNLDQDSYGVSSQFFKVLFSESKLKPQAREFLFTIKDLAKEHNIQNFLFFVPLRKVGNDLVKNFAKEMEPFFELKNLCADYKEFKGAISSEEKALLEDQNAASEAEIINAFFAKPSDKIRVAITCNKCGTGTTIKHLDAVCFLKDTTNAISFIQKSQRVRTPETGKTVGYCFCFNQWQGLKAFMDYAKATYKKPTPGDKAPAKDSGQALIDNGAIQLVLNAEIQKDFESIIDIMGTYRPGQYPLFEDLDFDELDCSRFMFLTSFEAVKAELLNRHKNDPDDKIRKQIKKAKTMDELRGAVGGGEVDEVARQLTPEEARALIEYKFVDTIKFLYLNGATLEYLQSLDYKQDDVDFIESNFSDFDLWKELCRQFPRYLGMIYKYLLEEDKAGRLPHPGSDDVDLDDLSDPVNPYEE